MDINRRNFLATAGSAALAVGALSIPKEAIADEGQGGDTLYGHGMVWNRELPGELGKLKLSFDLRVNLQTGKGFGSAIDPVHPDSNLHFSVDSMVQEKRPRGEKRFTLKGVVTEAANDANVGLPVAIVAETVGDTTAIAIKIGENAFVGAGLVVIAIIAILIGLLLPAVQKVR